MMLFISAGFRLGNHHLSRYIHIYVHICGTLRLCIAVKLYSLMMEQGVMIIRRVYNGSKLYV